MLTGLAALLPGHAQGDAIEPTVFVANVRDGPLPQRYAARIAEMPEVAAVSYLNFLPVLCSNGGTTTLNGFAGSETRTMLKRDYAADEATLAAWEVDPMGILIGDKLAQECGWSRGMHPSPRDGMRGRETEIHIVGTLHATVDTPFADHIAVAHYEYLDRLAGAEQRNQVTGIIARARDPAETGALAARIDVLFAHADPPTETEESGNAENGLERFGKMQIVLGWVMAAMAACFTLVLVSVMGHTAAERRATFAVMRVLGFRTPFLLASFAAEFAVITTAGIAIGIAGGQLFIASASPLLAGILGAFAPPAWIWWALPAAFASALAVGLIVPAVVIARTRAVDY